MNASQSQRWGHFTSSEIWKLMQKDKAGTGFGKGALTYINHKKWELKLKRSITLEANSKATIWGQYVETRVHKKLGFEYKLCSTERIAHNSIPMWSGAPDCVTTATVCDIKCPELISFCDLLDVFETQSPEVFKKEYPEYYWQLVSNSILTGLDHAELIVYVPYNKDLAGIKLGIENYDGEMDLDQLKRIFYAGESSLAWIPDDCKIQDLNKFKFLIPEKDKEDLTNTVIRAIEKVAE